MVGSETQTPSDEGTKRLKKILDVSINEIHIFDALDLKFVQMSKGARRNLGYSEEEVFNLTPLDINPELNLTEFRTLLDTLTAGDAEFANFEAKHKRKDGSLYPVSITLYYSEDEQPPVFLAIIEDLTKSKISLEKLRHYTHNDHLTGLANRSLMMDRLRNAVERAKRTNQRIDLLFIDLNRFKEINDTRGHAAGDTVLAEVANRLRSTLRASETIARIGGDEFVVLAENSDRSGVTRIIDRLQRALANPIHVEGTTVKIGASIGVSTFPDDSQDPEELPRLADIAMYDAKKRGCGFQFYEAQMAARIQMQHSIADRLAKSIRESSLDLHYQPFVDFASGKVVGAEALLRWSDQRLGLVPPSSFIPIAEDRGMMKEIGRWVVERAIRQCSLWRAAGLNYPKRLAINLAAQQLEDEQLVDCLVSVSKQYKVPLSAIEIEVTESSMMADPVRSAVVLSKLKRLGISLSIDDFGTGYSSLSYLRLFSFDKLKIDKCFVRDLETDQNSVAIISATVAMARGLGLEVHAEGVETEGQLRMLSALDCNTCQGFLLGKPAPSQEFSELWLTRRQTVLQ